MVITLKRIWMMMTFAQGSLNGDGDYIKMDVEDDEICFNDHNEDGDYIKTDVDDDANCSRIIMRMVITLKHIRMMMTSSMFQVVKSLWPNTPALAIPSTVSRDLRPHISCSICHVS